MQRFFWLILFVFLLSLFFPVAWLRAKPQGSAATAEAVAIMGFGFERDSAGNMTAGVANQFLLNWSLKSFPAIKVFFVQEGVWQAVCAASAKICFVDGVQLRRIDKHNDKLDLHTMDIAVCALERMRLFKVRQVVLVAHDLQLWRTQDSFERAKATLCPDCSFVVPAVPPTPFPKNSEQLRTRSAFIYKWVELLARLRYSPWLYRSLPATCPAPMPDEE